MFRQTIGRSKKTEVGFSTLVCLMVAIQSAVGQSATPVESSEREAPVAMEGLWPSDALTKSLLIRWSDTVMADYSLTDEQRTEIRDAVSDRWSGFLKENRSRLQPILNEFLELRLAPKPPTAKQLQSWAERAAPLLDLAGKEMLAGNDDFRRVLSPLQRAKFELDALQLNAGIQLAKQRLARWEQGEIDVADVWEPTGEARDRNKTKANDKASKSASPADAHGSRPPVQRVDRIREEISTWEAYAARFIKVYRLDEAQRATALSCLYELTSRAHSRRQRYRIQIENLERQIEAGATDDQREGLIADLKDLYGPIDKMFEELKNRLHSIPTTAQKDAAATLLPFGSLLGGRPGTMPLPGSNKPAAVDDPK